MKSFFQKPYCYAVLFAVLLIGASTLVLLDTFVIPKSYKKEIEKTDTLSGSDVIQSVSGEGKGAAVTASSYEDANIYIKIETQREYDTTIYTADIKVSDISYLKTAFANDTYGRNIKKTTSEMADSNHAIFAVNGDFYGFRDYGYVLRNGTLYRETAGNAQDLVIDNKGEFSIIKEEETSMKDLVLPSIWQILSFGPALLEDGKTVVDSASEVSKSLASNPRTAIGMISPLHYIVAVSDGRTEESAGLSLLNLAKIFKDKGCITAYNLDGGGSSTMYFNGEIINIPTDGRTFGERKVSDIVYIGY